MSSRTENQVPVDQQAAILVVDDNPLIVDVLRGLLRTENYQVFTSSNGHEAVSVIETKKIDVIICDVMMPKMGGYEFFDVVRKRAECAHIPFVFLTALDSRDEIDRGKELGADDYLCKPFEPRELLAVVKGKVARSSTIRAQNAKTYDSYRRRVIHTLSHEFRTPLVAINTGMEILIEQMQGGQSSRTKGLLDAVKRGGQRLEKLVNDFMILQQIDAGVTRKNFETRSKIMKVSAILNKYSETNGRSVVAQGGSLETVDLSLDVSVKIVETQLLDCIDRLVSNALKFSTNDKSIEIQAYPCEEEVCIDIKDRGIGLDPQKLDEAIDIFGQIDREKLEQQGGGLGLPITTQLVAIHGGRLEFEQRPGGGSIVSIVLPIHREPGR